MSKVIRTKYPIASSRVRHDEDPSPSTSGPTTVSVNPTRANMVIRIAKRPRASIPSEIGGATEGSGSVQRSAPNWRRLSDFALLSSTESVSADRRIALTAFSVTRSGLRVKNSLPHPPRLCTNSQVIGEKIPHGSDTPCSNRRWGGTIDRGFSGTPGVARPHWTSAPVLRLVR